MKEKSTKLTFIKVNFIINIMGIVIVHAGYNFDLKLGQGAMYKVPVTKIMHA